MQGQHSSQHLEYGKALATAEGAHWLLLLNIEEAVGLGMLHSAHTFHSREEASRAFMRLSWPRSKDAELYENFNGKWELIAAEWHSVMVGDL